MTTQVRRYSQGDEDALFSFREKNFPVGHRNHDRNHFRWKYLEHPFSSEIPFFVMESEGRIVGTQGYWPTPVVIDGKKLLCGQLIDFYAEEPFRGMPVIHLFRAVSSSFDLAFASNLSEDARRFFSAARWVDPSSTLMNYFMQLHKIKGSGVFGSVKHLGNVVNYSAKNLNILRKIDRNVTFELSDRLPEGIGSILSSHTPTSRIYIGKDRAYYCWRYKQAKNPRYAFLSLFTSGELKAVAIFLVKAEEDRKLCTIMDIISNSSESAPVQILLSELINYCKREKDVMNIQSVSFSSLKHIFQACGFRISPSGFGFMLAPGFKSFLGPDCEIGNFNFMLGDSDAL